MKGSTNLAVESPSRDASRWLPALLAYAHPSLRHDRYHAHGVGSTVLVAGRPFWLPERFPML